MNFYRDIVFFLIQMIVLFFVTRGALNAVFGFLRMFIRHEPSVFVLVSFIYLPGTILHELAHFVFAIACFLKVRSVSVIPSWEKNYIKLGSVVYEKKDMVRSIMVGIAPFFAGLAFFWFVDFAKLFPSSQLIVNAVMVYLIFTVSSTMFSSKQDLIDVVYLIPLVTIFIGAMYVFNIRVSLIFGREEFLFLIHAFIQHVNLYLFFSIMINATLIILCKGLQLGYRK